MSQRDFVIKNKHGVIHQAPEWLVARLEGQVEVIGELKNGKIIKKSKPKEKMDKVLVNITDNKETPLPKRLRKK